MYTTNENRFLAVISRLGLFLEIANKELRNQMQIARDFHIISNS